MKHVEIVVAAIHPNPYRDFRRNPINEDQVKKIGESIGRTGFWDNIVVRKHPEIRDAYQLAYGHSRLEAVKRAGIESVRLPVADLSDWEMYCAMVDENETQQEMTSAIAFENIETGVKMLEAAFREIGPEGIEEQFWHALGHHLDVPRGTSKTWGGHGFTNVRNDFFRGEGIGRVFVVAVLPSGGMHPQIVSEVLNSLYGQQRAEAKRKQAEEKEAEAKRKRAQAEAEADERKKEAARKAAEEAEAEAAKLRGDAKRIGAGTVKESILLAFKTPRLMAAFASAIKTSKIPPKLHEAAKDHALEADLTIRTMAGKIADWWYEVSGQKDRDYHRIQKEEAYRRFRKRIQDGNFREYLVKVGETAKGLTADMKIAMDAAKYYDNAKHRAAMVKTLANLVGVAQQLMEDLSGEVIHVDPSSNGSAIPASLPAPKEVDSDD